MGGRPAHSFRPDINAVVVVVIGERVQLKDAVDEASTAKMAVDKKPDQNKGSMLPQRKSKDYADSGPGYADIERRCKRGNAPRAWPAVRP
jgi:hypothetical protein